MKDPFNSAPKTSREEKKYSGSKLWQAIENNESTEDIANMLTRTNEKGGETKELWTFLNDKDIFRIDPLTNKLTDYAKYSLKELIEKLKETKKKEAA